MDFRIKDLVSDQTTYQKEESFESFFLKHSVDEMSMRERIEGLRARYSPGPNSHFDRVVTTAMDDILAPRTGSGLFKLNTRLNFELSRINDQDLPRYLFYRYRYDRFPAAKQLDTYPPCLQVEITSVCNFRCVFCYQTDEELTSKKNSHMGMMSPDLFRKIIDEAEGQCEAITLASRGEPMVCKDFSTMVRYLRGKFLATKINTNASLLNEEKCHAILESDIQTLVFSADAASEPMYSQLRVNGNLETVVKNINRFKEIKDRQYPASKMITRVSGVKVNSHQGMSDMEQFWGDLVDEISFVKYNPWENTYARPINDESRPCTDLWRRAFVWWDGRMNPCDVDYRSELCIGNVAGQSVSALWNSEAYQNLRQLHLNQKRKEASPCNRCTQV